MSRCSNGGLWQFLRKPSPWCLDLLPLVLLIALCLDNCLDTFHGHLARRSLKAVPFGRWTILFFWRFHNHRLISMPHLLTKILKNLIIILIVIWGIHRVLDLSFTDKILTLIFLIFLFWHNRQLSSAFSVNDWLSAQCTAEKVIVIVFWRVLWSFLRLVWPCINLFDGLWWLVFALKLIGEGCEMGLGRVDRLGVLLVVGKGGLARFLGGCYL